MCSRLLDLIEYILEVSMSLCGALNHGQCHASYTSLIYMMQDSVNYNRQKKFAVCMILSKRFHTDVFWLVPSSGQSECKMIF